MGCSSPWYHGILTTLSQTGRIALNQSAQSGYVAAVDMRKWTPWHWLNRVH
jgi:hypothetical protein